MGLTLATLPGVRVQPFYLAPMDVPDPLEPTREWERAVRLKGRGVTSVDGEGGAEAGGEAGVGEPIFVTYSTSQSIDSFGDFVVGMDAAFPNSKKIGTIASTVSRQEAGGYERTSGWPLRPVPCVSVAQLLAQFLPLQSI